MHECSVSSVAIVDRSHGYDRVTTIIHALLFFFFLFVLLKRVLFYFFIVGMFLISLSVVSQCLTLSVSSLFAAADGTGCMIHGGFESVGN